MGDSAAVRLVQLDAPAGVLQQQLLSSGRVTREQWESVVEQRSAALEQLLSPQSESPSSQGLAPGLVGRGGGTTNDLQAGSGHPQPRKRTDAKMMLAIIEPDAMAGMSVGQEPFRGPHAEAKCEDHTRVPAVARVSGTGVGVGDGDAKDAAPDGSAAKGGLKSGFLLETPAKKPKSMRPARSQQRREKSGQQLSLIHI